MDVMMSTQGDIQTREDIRRLVDAFYEKINRDELLGPIFNQVAKVDWAAHLPTMYRFWESMLLGGEIIRARPFRNTPCCRSLKLISNSGSRFLLRR